ncbi:hypothetical protein B0H11DRAFT_1974841, partial [Mycena galericulata]
MPALRTRDTHPAARSLQVSTAAPPPSLTIIAPTPRTFTFPTAHNLADSPYTSPSNSPFEPDLAGALALSASSASTPSPSVTSRDDEFRTPPPLSVLQHTFSPASESFSPLATPAPVPRKSSSRAEERRPKKGDDDYVKRPENAFILFRRQCCQDEARALSSPSPAPSAPSPIASGPSPADPPAPPANPPGKKQRQADLSKMISQKWKALSPEERAHWEGLAKEKKREHETLHPNYVYRPQRSRPRNSISAAPPSSATQRRKPSAPPEQVEFVVPTHGRSASAPAPPPYQTIQIPNVYSAGSGDSAPSLMSMISHHGMGNGDGGFDYLPSLAGPFAFEANLQSSDFLRAMFPPTMSAVSPPPASAGVILSPASSPSGSGPSSPYTPASASFHPSVFSSSYTGPSSFTPPAGALTVSHDAPADLGQGLDPAGTSLQPVDTTSAHPDASYASYASAWAAASPWASMPTTMATGLADGDFDIGRIPEIGWEMGCSAFPGSEFPSGEFGTQGMDMGGEEFAGPSDSALGLHFGDLGMGQISFDDMMAGQ